MLQYTLSYLFLLELEIDRPHNNILLKEIKHYHKIGKGNLQAFEVRGYLKSKSIWELQLTAYVVIYKGLVK